MLTVEYSRSGYHISDFDVLEWANEKIQDYLEWKEAGKENNLLIVSSGIIIDTFRMMVVEGKISHEDIQFKFNKEMVPINEFGNPEKWPQGFGDVSQNITYRTLKAQSAKRKGGRNA